MRLWRITSSVPPPVKMGGRSEDATPRPSLRTGQADLPHPALQLASCSLSETGKFAFLELVQVHEPELRKVAVSPALMVSPSSAAFASPALAQD